MQITLTRTIYLRVAIVCTLAFIACAANAQTSSPQIIPAPKQITPGEGSFALSGNTRITLADSKSAEDRFAVQDFINDIKTTADVTPVIGKGSGRRDILVGRVDSLPVAQALKLSGAPAGTTLNEEGYVIVVNPDRVVVAGNTTAGTFYGLQTLKQLVRGNGATA